MWITISVRSRLNGRTDETRIWRMRWQLFRFQLAWHQVDAQFRFVIYIWVIRFTKIGAWSTILPQCEELLCCKVQGIPRIFTFWPETTFRVHKSWQRRRTFNPIWMEIYLCAKWLSDLFEVCIIGAYFTMQRCTQSEANGCDSARRGYAWLNRMIYSTDSIRKTLQKSIESTD